MKTIRTASASWRSAPVPSTAEDAQDTPGSGRPRTGRRAWGPWRRAARRKQRVGAERARVPGPARGAVARPGGGVIEFGRSSLTVQVAVGGAVFLGWDGTEMCPSEALRPPGRAPELDTRAVLEPDTDGGWRLVSERLLVTVSRHGAVELRTPGGELLRRDLPPRWWEPVAVPEQGGEPGPGDARPREPERGRWMHRSQVAADARFFGLGGHVCGPRLPDGSYELRGPGGEVPPEPRHGPSTPRVTMPLQLVVADAGTHLVFYDNPGAGRVVLREGLEGRGSGHDRPGSSEFRMGGGPLRYWVIAGPPARVLHGWARLTGSPALPPAWALGHQYALGTQHPGSLPRAREAAAGYRERELPLGAVHLTGGEDGTSLRARWGEWGRQSEQPDPAGELAAAGVHVESGGTGGGFTLVRSGWAGMQRTGGSWDGEVATGWPGLRESLSLVVGLGLCGVPYAGTQIGGATAAPSPELYLRWFQLAAYFPLFHVHAAKGTGHREPWAFGEEVLTGCAAAMAERERLRPYFTTLAHLAHRTGAPYVRPLWWQHSRERALRECGDAFLLGDALLVAPVLTEGARERRVRLPFGRWYETVSGAVHEGPGEVTLEAPLSRIPVLARAGAAVPVSGADGGVELEVWSPAPGRRGKGLVIRDVEVAGAPGATGVAGATRVPGARGSAETSRRRPAPAERFTVLRDGGTTEVTREDGAPVGYPVRVRT